MSKLLYFQQNRSLPQLANGFWAHLANTAFAFFIVLALCTPSWRTGPFTWWPLWQLSIPQEQPARLGIFSLLPIVAVLAWMVDHFGSHRRPRWQWGSAAMTLPLLLLSLLILLGLEPAREERTFIQGIGVGLFWFSYLYILNRRPQLAPSLLLVVLVQGSVAVAQFALQRDLGLASIGEFTLDPQVPGTSVLWNSRQEAWLRGYGLTAHPNVLGGMMAVLLLLLLSQGRQHQRWHQAILSVGLAVGSLGLLVSFSRTGWLAFAGGLLFLAMRRGDSRKPRWPFRVSPCSWQSRHWQWLPLLTVPLFLLLYHDLILNRWFHLDTLIEARSIHERLRDVQIALHLIGAHLWSGVGAGNALESAQILRADAGPVHNVFLLVMVELGLLGGICWLLFMILPLLPDLSSRVLRHLSTHDFTSLTHVRTHVYIAAWIGLLIAGFFDTPLWLTTSWRAALLLGLLAALQVQKSEGGKEEA